MQSQSRLLDDLARVASGALGVATGMRSEVEARLREQFERIVAQMDLVTREEHDVVLAMARKAREEQEDLESRVKKLERRITQLESGIAGTGGESTKSAAGKRARSRSQATETRKTGRGKAGGSGGGSAGEGSGGGPPST